MKITLVENVQHIYTGAVYDVLRAMGYPNQVLPNDIRALDKGQRIKGKVFTIEGRRDDSLDPHQSLLQWCGLLSRAPGGHVVICQPNDTTMAHMGELSAETLSYKGVHGYIVDGGCRDTAFIEKTGFPVFCKYRTPVDIVGRWAATAFGEPITIGGVKIHTGDYVVGDEDGIVVIPESIAVEVIDKTAEVWRTENKVRKAILEGTDPVEAYLAYGKF